MAPSFRRDTRRDRKGTYPSFALVVYKYWSSLSFRVARQGLGHFTAVGDGDNTLVWQ